MAFFDFDERKHVLVGPGSDSFSSTSKKSDSRFETPPFRYTGNELLKAKLLKFGFT